MAVVYPAAKAVLGPYELGERLGTGGMAEVYVARRAGPHGFAKRFAVKRILPQLARDSRFVAMFCDEARIAAQLCHPNIVQVVDFGEFNGEVFMAMEHVDGLSLAKLLRSVAARGERFPLGAGLYIAHEVLRALSFAHEACDDHGRSLGIVHRDVSPGNILIGRAGEVKLTDFGIVLSSFVDRRTYPGELKGKLGYMSPEQVIGSDVDARSDLFTVGIVLAEMLLARPLFPGQTEIDVLTRIYEADVRVLDKFGAELREDLREVLRTVLAREPRERFQSAAEFAERLRDIARSAGMTLSDVELVPWLHGLAVLPSSSGTREISVPAALPRPRPKRPPEAARWVAHTSGGGRSTPIATRELAALLCTGRYTAETLVTSSGTAKRALGAIRELAPLAARGAYRFRERVEERAAWHRPLDRARLPALLFELVQGGATGMLVARAGAREKRVFFASGQPCFVASTQRAELLGERLVAAGSVQAVDVEDALDACVKEPTRRLGDALVAARRLKSSALLRALIKQLEARFVELGTWNQGELWLVPNATSDEEVPRAPVGGAALISRAVRECYAAPELEAHLASVRDAPLLRGVAGLVDVLRLGLTSAERAAIEMAPVGSLEVLCARAQSTESVSREDALRAVFVGLSCGLLVSPAWQT